RCACCRVLFPRGAGSEGSGGGGGVGNALRLQAEGDAAVDHLGAGDQVAEAALASAGTRPSANSPLRRTESRTPAGRRVASTTTRSPARRLPSDRPAPKR